MEIENTKILTMNSEETPILRTDLRSYIPLIASGKVREIYELDKSTLLFVTTDRISGMILIQLPAQR